MGLYYSDDERFVINTMEYPPSTYLSEKGIADSKAATVIQRWWRNLQNPCLEDDANTDTVVVESDLEVECNTDSDCESDCDSDCESNCDSDSDSECNEENDEDDEEEEYQPTCFDEIFNFINTIFFY